MWFPELGFEHEKDIQENLLKCKKSLATGEKFF